MINVFILLNPLSFVKGFKLMESIFSNFGTKIVVINATKEEDFQQELTTDLISIIHHFSMKLYSNRQKL
jgi:predicted site-specific integrase-resolvase